MSVGRKQSEYSMKIMSDIANNNNNNLDKLAKKVYYTTNYMLLRNLHFVYSKNYINCVNYGPFNDGLK